MNKRNKILPTGIAIVVLGVGFGIHEGLLAQTQHKVSETEAKFNVEQSKLEKMQQDLLTYEHSRSSNLKGSFTNTTFQKSEEVVLPIQQNYKMSSTEVSQWIAAYITELRKLNNIDNKAAWNNDSPEQKFAQSIATAFDGTSNGVVHISDPKNYAFSSYSGVTSTTTPSVGMTESDQETAYNIVMNLYDQSGSESAKLNTGADPNSRTYLLYSGENIGVAASSGVISFDYNPEKASSKREEALEATPLPDITFDYVDMNLVKQAQAKIKSQQTKVSKDTKKLKNAEHKMNQVKKYFF